MAANLDKAESSLTAVSDIAYLRGIDSSGNSVRISKADLASVLGGIYIELQNEALDLNSVRSNRVIFINNQSLVSNRPAGMGNDRGFLWVFQSSSYVGQIMYDQEGKQFWRWGLTDGTFWGNWQTIEVNIPSFYKNYNSLAELKAALAAI